MKSIVVHTRPDSEQFHELADSELLAVQGGAVDDFPWNSLKALVSAITGWTPNTMPGPRTVCIPK